MNTAAMQTQQEELKENSFIGIETLGNRQGIRRFCRAARSKMEAHTENQNRDDSLRRHQSFLTPARRARRRANRLRDMEAGEPRPLAREPVDVRRPDVLRAIATKIAVTEVISEDEDDVGMR